MAAERILEAVERLSEFPLVGRGVPEFDDADLRELLWRDYRIVYAISAERVTVVAVVHGARHLEDHVDPHA